MADLIVQPATRPLAGSVPAPPDRATAELALLVGALVAPAQPSRIRARGLGELVAAKALRQVGVDVERDDAGYLVTGVGLAGLNAPDAPLRLDRRASFATAAAGLLAAAAFASEIHGDPEALGVVMAGAARAIRARGGQIEGQLDPKRPGVLSPPITIAASQAPLSELQLELPPAALSIKLAALASGLMSSGETVVAEPVLSSDRFERLLHAVGVSIESAGAIVRLRPPTHDLAPFDQHVPGDTEGSIVLLAAALMVKDSRVGVRGIGHGPSRRGALDALVVAGAGIDISPRPVHCGEPTADVTLHTKIAPRGLALGGERGICAGASLPCLSALAAGCQGPSTLFDLVVDPSFPARARQTVAMLNAFGVVCEAQDAGLSVMGRAGETLTAARVDAEGDPSIAMAASVLALAADGPSTIEHADCIVESCPRFVGSLRALGANIEVTP
jgi:3-phosphoshikimate 1-carboxyvinyltransferase